MGACTEALALGLVRYVGTGVAGAEPLFISLDEDEPVV